MGEVLPRHYIIGILIFTLFIIGGVAMIGEFRKSDPSYVDDGNKFANFNKTFNVYTKITGQVSGMSDQVKEAKPDTGILGVLNGLVLSAWQTLRLLVSSLGFMGAVFGGLSSIFGIPAWIPAIVLSIVVVILVFSIFGAIFQRDL